MLNVHGNSEKAQPIKHDLERVSKLASTESIKLTEEEETLSDTEIWNMNMLQPKKTKKDDNKPLSGSILKFFENNGI